MAELLMIVDESSFDFNNSKVKIIYAVGGGIFKAYENV